MMGYLTDICGIEIEIVILFNPQFRDLDMFIDIETGMFERLLCTGHRTAVDRYQQFPRLGRFDHPGNMTSDAGETEVSADAIPREPYGGLVTDLADIGTARTRKN